MVSLVAFSGSANSSSLCTPALPCVLRSGKNFALEPLFRETRPNVLDLSNRSYCHQCPRYYRDVCNRATARSLCGVLPTDGDARLPSTLSPRNRDWLGRLITDHKDYCEADYEEFECRFRETSRAKDALAGFDVFFFLFSFWNQERRQRFVAAVKRWWGPAVPMNDCGVFSRPTFS